MKVLLLIFSVFVLGAGFASGQKEIACATAALVADANTGVDVRSGAGANSKILKTIPPEAAGTTVIIDGSKGGWIKISRATNSRKIVVFSGIGWVRASQLLVKTRSESTDAVEFYGSAGTETEAVVAGTVRAGLDVILQGCSGVWLKVLLPEQGTDGRPGWLPHTSYCGSHWDDWENCETSSGR